MKVEGKEEVVPEIHVLFLIFDFLHELGLDVGDEPDLAIMSLQLVPVGIRW
jgi:hypothetical protein